MMGKFLNTSFAFWHGIAQYEDMPGAHSFKKLADYALASLMPISNTSVSTFSASYLYQN